MAETPTPPSAMAFEQARNILSPLYGERLEHEVYTALQERIARALGERDERQHEIGTELSNKIAQVTELVRHNGVLHDKLVQAEAQLREREREAERLREGIDKARRESASDPDNRWARNATIILNALLPRRPAPEPTDATPEVETLRQRVAWLEDELTRRTEPW